ncbi:MAG: tRNA pseudouridine(38-40) synthase TruA [Clostridia bacterium]|nr:tRNA pseudouridine(38-40) synthase TruA [Clostridia bacterium]
MRIKLTLGYDGTSFCGWQVQKNGDTVQENLENAVFKVTGEKVRVTGSGRTDSGVHAMGQTAHFDTECKTVIPEKFYRALNAHLPESIRVYSSEKVADDFDACRTAKKKTYRYSLYLSEIENPLKERYAVRVDDKLDLKRMRECAKVFLGEHDFKCMCASGSSIKTTVRTLYNIDIEKDGSDLTISVCGNGFLYNMVRILVGTLLKAGRGETDEKELSKMLENKERALGGKTLPAKGLCLMKVEY